MEPGRKEFTKIKFAYVNPGGNPTALVLTKVIRKNQSKVATKIMEKIKACEQVGFVESSQNKKAICRLQMMGGEFCGNALRALAVWLSKTDKRKSPKFLVETSGAKSLIQISAKTDSIQNVLSAQAEFLLPFKVPILNKKIVLNGINILSKYIVLDGISFFVLARKFFDKKINFKLFFKKLYRQKVLKEQACGFIFYEEVTKNNFTIKPIVYVRQTDTLIYETSCASGSMALVIAKELKRIQVKQPSGFVLSLERKKSQVLVDGKVGGIKMLDINV